MTQSQFRKNQILKKIKVIYNPNAGKKRQIASFSKGITLEDIQELFLRYQLVAEFSPTKHKGHAVELAKEAAKDRFNIVVAAGGDGTISEVANGLVNTDTTMAILPMGTYMNTPNMLDIPTDDLEKAIMLIKLGRTRKIDVGSLTSVNGQDTTKSLYFLESAGMGIEAEFHRLFNKFEDGDFKSLWEMLKLPFQYFSHRAEIDIDDKVFKTRATLVTVSNAPFTGANLPIAPKAKLNDHRLTVSLYKMSLFEILRYFLKYFFSISPRERKIETHQGKVVKITVEVPKMVHADASILGFTPVEFKIIPNALEVITGFPKQGESSLLKRTYLDP